MQQKDIRQAVDWITKAKHLTAFTGAGVSVESGIPAFRGEDGIWSKYDPEILDISNYLSNPDETWPVIHELFYQFFKKAKPNRAHSFLAFMEEKKYLKSIITQNIDNLHQQAGSSNIIEYHGNSNYLVCTKCGDRSLADSIGLNADTPRCNKDGGLLKPDFVFFGEAIPSAAAQNAILEAEKSDVMILIGTTGEVMPASMIPRMAKNSGAKIIEINTEETTYTRDITDIFLQGRAVEVVEELWKLL